MVPAGRKHGLNLLTGVRGAHRMVHRDITKGGMQMATKAATTKKKTTPQKKSAPVKPAARKKVSKGESLVCAVCGLSVSVKEVGDIAIRRDRVLLCCGKPMKAKASKPKSAEAKPTRK